MRLSDRDAPDWVRVIALLEDGHARTRGECAAALGGLEWTPDTLATLAEQGVAVDGQTLRLARPLDLLDAADIRSQLSPEAGAWLRQLWTPLSVSSTNALLMAASRDEPIDGYAIAAEHQQAGRGRRGKQWHSPFAGNIYLSFGMHLPRQDLLSGYSLMVGVAVAEALEALGLPALGLKWPNDLQFENQKLGGILIESAGMQQTGFDLVIGIGLNVRLPISASQTIDQPFTDLVRVAEAVSGGAEVPARSHLVAEILNRVLAAHRELVAHGLASVLQRFGARDVLAGRPINAISNNETISGRAAGVNAVGELLVATGTGVVAVNGGEVSVRVRTA